jgi:hypothetical protein
MSDRPGDMGQSDDQLNLDNTADPLEDALGKADVGIDAPPEPAVYKALPGSRIPVSSKRGGVWKSRRDVAIKSMQDLIDAWDEAIRYYNHDQADHRDGISSGYRNRWGKVSGNRNIARRLNEMFSSTENIVFSNVSAQVPVLYAKNPIVSCSLEPSANPTDEDTGDQFAHAVEKFINNLFSMKYPPGVNLKQKAKRNVLMCLLTNMAWFEVGYTQKDKSSEAALQDLAALSQQLEQADDQEDIREIEGKLTALDEKVEFLQPSGPYVRIRYPHQVLRDPNGSDPNLSDCNWVLIEDMLPTQYINAIFAIEQPDSEEAVSIYEPTHILNNGENTNDPDAEYSLFQKTDNNYNAYGFETKEAFDKACMTKVWYVWDKVTRRLEMYADNDWKWPIWVWDDPYQLQGFFPLTPLWFHDNPIALYAKGEVSYYLDQQDQINEINDEKRRALYWARRNIFYNKNSGLTQETVDKILKGPDATATPLDVPDGVDPTKMIFSLTPPSMNFAQLFDKKDLYESVDRIAATSEAERGGEFKTNTTNKAIDYYSTMGNMRMDMRLDAIEDAIGDVGWKLTQLCMRFMDAQTASDICGIDVSPFWRPLDNLRDYARMSLQVVGGSTQKLTTQQKKQESVQIAQVLSQYVRAAPATALKVSLNMMSKAFDDFMISKEDWDNIAAEVQQMAQSQQGGAPGGAPSPQQAGAQPGGASGASPQAGGGGGMPVVAMLVQAMQQLPPPVLQAIGQALAQGIPPAQVFQQLLSQQGGSTGQQPGGPQMGPAQQGAPR